MRPATHRGAVSHVAAGCTGIPVRRHLIIRGAAPWCCSTSSAHGGGLPARHERLEHLDNRRRRVHAIHAVRCAGKCLSRCVACSSTVFSDRSVVPSTEHAGCEVGRRRWRCGWLRRSDFSCGDVVPRQQRQAPCSASTRRLACQGCCVPGVTSTTVRLAHGAEARLLRRTCRGGTGGHAAAQFDVVRRSSTARRCCRRRKYACAALDRWRRVVAVRGQRGTRTLRRLVRSGGGEK